MQNKPRFYYPELDGLRFIAFLLVFIHNAPSISSNKNWTLLHEYGWIGVDLFFCLSGFLITKLLVVEYQHDGEIHIRHFYFRRILRIWPLYFFYITIGLIFIILTEGWLPVLPKHFAGLTTFTYNVVYLFLTYQVFAVYFHLWTISYEEQFYIVIPWAIRKFLQNTKRMNWLYILAFFVSGNLIRAAFIYFSARHPVVYLLPITHFEAMLGGVAIGLGLFDDLLVNVKNSIVLLVGLALNAIIFALPNMYEISWNLILTYFLVGAGMTLIVFGITNSNTSLINRLLRNELLVYLGKISYGLYVYHLLSISLIIFVAQRIMKSFNISSDLDQIIYFFAGLLITILLSIASYNFLEKPFLKLKERFSPIISRTL